MSIWSGLSVTYCYSVTFHPLALSRSCKPLEAATTQPVSAALSAVEVWKEPHSAWTQRIGCTALKTTKGWPRSTYQTSPVCYCC